MLAPPTATSLLVTNTTWESNNLAQVAAKVAAGAHEAPAGTPALAIYIAHRKGAETASTLASTSSAYTGTAPMKMDERVPRRQLPSSVARSTVNAANEP